MPADIRAAVLDGVLVVQVEVSHSSALPIVAKEGYLKALRLLREEIERHRLDHDTWDGKEESFCARCNVDWPCPTIVSAAQVYAPDALPKEKA